MQVSGDGGKGQRAFAALRVRAGTALLFVLFLIAAAAEPSQDRQGGRPVTPLVGRLAQVAAGTVLMGLAIAVLVDSALGLLPLDVLHRAIADRVGVTIGGAFVVVQSLLLVINLSLGTRPGVGTIASIAIPAVVADVALTILPVPGLVWLRVLGLLLGGAMFATGTAWYLSAQLGALPRDGLMLAIEQRTGWGMAHIRVGADLLCLTAGVLIVNPITAVRTGSLGIGSVLLALALGPAINHLRSSMFSRRALDAEANR